MLNGMPLLLLTIAAFFLSPTALQSYGARNWWACCGFQWPRLFFSVLPCASHRAVSGCLTTDQRLRERAAKGEKVSCRLRRSVTAQHYFFGLAFNLRLFGADLKMLLYALGACALAWNTLRRRSGMSPRPRASCSSTRPLLVPPRVHVLECVHLYTYDLFCEKLGSSPAGAA